MKIKDIDNYSTIQKIVVAVEMGDEEERVIDVFVETEIDRNTHYSGISDIMINENGDCPKDLKEEKEIIEFVKSNLK